MKVSFLGGGPFGTPIREALQKAFGLVPSGEADIWVVASYGRILKRDEFSQPRFGTIVVHPSLLPLYRGASPIQSALRHGDTKTGVALIAMDEQVDHGPIIAQKELAVSPNDRYATLAPKLAAISGDLLVKVLPKYIAGEITPVEQDHAKATFTKKLERDDGLLDLKKPADFLERQVRAYWPWPGSFVWLTDSSGAKKRLIIHQAHVADGHLIPDLVQLEGRKPTSWSEFARGWRGSAPFSY
ncbi:methionyl-tRNA formyltransferase [Candidatus Berkelbacteria bacterium]|nr:methionyl-tRNA formyltransferase [Candidatus Berkelbacteria bacterium]